MLQEKIKELRMSNNTSIGKMDIFNKEKDCIIEALKRMKFEKDLVV
jgi:hypothetical protein